MSSKKFQKKIEDFVCEKCGTEVRGTGFTNHCPECLWGKHVDINPGDRLSECGGMMKPVGVESRGDDFTILHRCEKCSFERKNKRQERDNFDTLVALSKHSK